ncbi:uncharacterized protein CDAR_186911 [Caerostris darwini]|uniref:Uncharacterized protein n=1 Tax=Caerostris darwini TaxID=1538125 RepID=A0AAV4PPL0_9ARAC|nr:uncharacterized protein CDAR_186911 [Caerostris darwini]
MDSCDCAYDSQKDDCCDCDKDSQRFEKEFERLLQLIFPRLPFPIIHDALLNFRWLPTKHHLESFLHFCIKRTKNNHTIAFPPRKLAGYPRVLTEVTPKSWKLEMAIEIPSLDVNYEFPDSEIVCTSCHCKEVTYGPTLYCRGEFVLVLNKSVSLLRSGLPPLAMAPSNVKRFKHITVTPKYDGGLINILLVPVTHSNYTLLKDLFEDKPVYTHPYGLFFVGSKKYLITTSHLRRCFEEVCQIDMDELIQNYADYFKDQTRMQTHFEIINKDERINSLLPAKLL